jgi:hypothetical protein
MRLVHRNAYVTYLWAACEHGFGDGAGGAFHQPIAPAAECLNNGFDHEVVGNRILQLVGPRCVAEIEVELQIDLESLSDLGFVLHHAVIGVKRQTLEEDSVAHCARLIAAPTASA